MKSAIVTPDTVTPASKPPSGSGPIVKPTTTGVKMASAPGATMRFREASVEIFTQRAVSGFALPSSSPGISRN